MTRHDPRVDAYIARAEPFARPILLHLRAVVHEACPEVEEAIKWGFPHFLYHGNLCFMASFKGHCGFGFWKGRQVEGAPGRRGEAMGQYGRITSQSDLPARTSLKRHVRAAMKLNEMPAPARKPATRRPAVRTPADLAAALRKAPAAAVNFKALSPGHRREYVQWITEAKREETRRRRVDTTIEWLTQGRSRNWKYQRSR
jgi:hypothetical protein